MITFKYHVKYDYYMVVLYDAKVPYFHSFNWREGIEDFMVFEYSFKNFQKMLKNVFPKSSWIKRLLIRGFTDGTYIYTLNSEHWYAKIGYNRMMRHEVAHIKKRGKHRWWIPDLMHPTWLFRWSDEIWQEQNQK